MIDDNPDITIEHIFPQNPDPKWKMELGTDEYTFIKENYLNTIGNLTLSGNNGKLGNKTFLDKKQLEGAGYKDSRLWLNKYLSTLNNWDRKEIEKRFSQVADRFLAIWKYPEIQMVNDLDSDEMALFKNRQFWVTNAAQIKPSFDFALQNKSITMETYFLGSLKKLKS